MLHNAAQAYEADRSAPRLLTIGEVAARLRVHHTTVRRRIKDGSIPAVRLGVGDKNQLRVPADELEAWLFGENESAA